MEKTTQPWLVVSLKDTMETMGRDPQISENDIFGQENFIAWPPRRVMTFPETRVDLNRLIKKIKPKLKSKTFQIFKNSIFPKNSNFQKLRMSFISFKCLGDPGGSAPPGKNIN